MYSSTMKYTLLITHLIALSYTINLSNNLFFSHGAFDEQQSSSSPIPHSEKITHLHFYFHDIISGKKPTAKQVIGSTLYGFGSTFIADDALTENPELKSKVVGRAQGMYSVASPNDLALLMLLIFEFTQGKFNGSSVSMLGRNHVLDSVREMPIVGGSGIFRFARGYALAHTFNFDVPTGDATVEYNLTVLHF